MSVNVLNFSTLDSDKESSEQTVQAQIRLLLKEQSDQGLHWLLYWETFCLSNTWWVISRWKEKKESVQNFRTFTIEI